MNGLWRRAVCVLGLLVGLLAMHGLAPGGAPHVAHTAHMETRPMAAGAAEAHDGCSDCGTVHHADAACSAAAVSGAPALSGLAADPVPVAVRDAVAHPR
ncbi:DUF6153 family protein, partial [Streptomyces sp. NPDC002920]